MSLNQPDLDLLADYVGGALDGTPDEERVGERIRSDAEWAAAYADLVSAFDNVSSDLRAYGRPAEPMPDDVWARLEAALSSESTVPPAYGDRAPSFDGLPTAPPVFTAPRDNRPPGRAARRRRHVQLPVLAAVAVLLVLSLGVFALKNFAPLGTSQDSGGKAADAPAPAAAGPLIYQRASGRDYTEDTLVLATDFGSVPFSSNGQSESLSDKSARVNTSASYASAIPPALEPLTVADRLAKCLEAVTAVMPGQVLGVDYATYQRTPAALIVVRTPDDARWVGVAGADCGNKGADLLAQKRLN